MFDSVTDTRNFRRRRGQSSSQAGPSSSARQSAQELEIQRLQEELRQQREYQMQQSEYQRQQNEYFANQASQQQAFFSSKSYATFSIRATNESSNF